MLTASQHGRKRRSRSRSRERGVPSRGDGKDRRHNPLQLKTGDSGPSASKREKQTDLTAPDATLLVATLPAVDEEEETRRIMEKLRQE